jgi:hypothetical protein
MALRRPDSQSGPHKERTTGTFTTTIKDNAGVAIPGASLSTLTLTLYSEHTLAIINLRDRQNVLNQNNVTVDGSGVLTWSIQTLDRVIGDDANPEERHRALFEWTAPGVAGKHEHQFIVTNLARVP